MNKKETKAAAARLHLAAEVFYAVYNGSETFRESDIGADLAYLLGAITDTSMHVHVDWRAEEYSGEDKLPALLPILKDAFKPEHDVWKYIILD